MDYEWDNKKPTAQMLGRWQPFHDGHYTLFKEIMLLLILFVRHLKREVYFQLII